MRNLFDEWALLIGVVLMVVISATAAYLKELEKATVEWARRKHFFVLFSKMIYAAFSGLIVWYGSQSVLHWGYKFPEPLIPMAVGIAGYAGAQFIDFLFSFFTDLARKKAGLEPKEPPK